MKYIFGLLPLALFAQEGQAAPTSNLTQMILMIGIALAFFYFILYRPEQKRRKKAQEMRGALKKGDKVTAMGIIGTVVRIKENSVIIKTGEEAKIEMLKAAITEVVSSSNEEKQKEPASNEA